MPRKRGQLSTDEQNFINDNIQSMSMSDIASHLNRTIKPVEKYCKENNLTYKGMSEEIFDDTLLRARLESRAYWEEVKKQFNDADLEYFATTWVSIIKQFRDNILYTEELQVKQWITLEILGNHVMEARLKSKEQVMRLSDLLDREYSLDEEVRDVENIARLEAELAMIRNSMSSYTTEHAKILDRVEKSQRDLKADRAARVKTIEDSKSSFTGFLKSLEDSKIRQSVGEQLEMNKMAKDKLRTRFVMSGTPIR